MRKRQIERKRLFHEVAKSWVKMKPALRKLVQD